MGGEGGKLLSDAIKAHPNYEQIAQNMFNGDAKVNMSNKGLDAGDAWIMGAALEKNDTVTEVAVSSNNLGVEGGKALAECLKSNTTITQVRLCFSMHAISKNRGAATRFAILSFAELAVSATLSVVMFDALMILTRHILRLMA